MNHSIILFTALSIFSIISCSSSEQNTEKETPLKSNQQIQFNQSRVLAEVEDIYVNGAYNFIIKAKVLDVEEDPAYPSMAVKGNVYSLIPNFQLDENKNVIGHSDKNINLSGLSELQKGEKFKAIIFFEYLKGWYIQEVL
jgi:hypothetical protein